MNTTTTLARTIARALIGSTFARLGYDAFHAPGGRADAAGPLLEMIRKVAPIPGDHTMVRFNGAAQSVAGTALAAGIAPRASAAALIGSLAPTTLAGHPFWQLDDPAARAGQRVQFQKNLALLGGLLLIMLPPGQK